MASQANPPHSPHVAPVAMGTAVGGNKRRRLEIPIFGAECAELAVSLGAGRLELNASGSYGELKCIRFSTCIIQQHRQRQINTFRFMVTTMTRC